jgi:hypothetical protein
MLKYIHNIGKLYVFYVYMIEMSKW